MTKERQVELKTEVAGIELEHPIMNAAGTCKSLEDVRELARSVTAAVMVGSITVEPRMGNTGDVYWAGQMFSLNSLGLPNRGAPYYKEVLSEMATITHGEGKPLFVSVAGFSPEEYASLAELAFHDGADLVELNLSCPNVWAGNTQKRITGFDGELVFETLHYVRKEVGINVRVSAKISPFTDPYALAEIVRTIGQSDVVKVVTAVNTVPNAFSYNGREARIAPGGGLAGFAGPALKPIGLGHVRQLRGLLPENVQVIGVGGVTHGQDVWEYRDSGAVVTQVATAYLERHEQVFSSLLGEFVEVLDS